MKQWVVISRIKNKPCMVRNDHCLMLLKRVLIAIMFMPLVAGYAAAESSISSQRQAELHNLLLQDCGSCHGMTMKGGLGPALTAEVLKTKSRQMIEITILQGRPGTPMPPWNKILTKDEVRWIVDKLYEGDSL